MLGIHSEGTFGYIDFFNLDCDAKAIQKLIQQWDCRRAFNSHGTPKVKEVVVTDYYNVCLVYRKRIESGGGDETVGFIQMEFSALKGDVYISYLYVDERVRRRGIGKLLLEQAEILAKESWAVKRFYALTIENTQMETLFNKMNYNEMGVYKDFIYRDGKYRDQKLFIKTLNEDSKNA